MFSEGQGIILNEGVLLRASKYFTIVPLPYTNLLSEVLQIYRRHEDRWQKSLKVRGFQTGSHGASDSKQVSLQPPLLLSGIPLGKENKEEKTWEPWLVDTGLLSVQRLFCKGTCNINAELLLQLHARSAA